MRKPIDLLVVTTLVLGILQIVLPLNNSTVEAGTPDDGVDGLQYIDGDWYVNGSESYTNEIIVLSGNLTINSGASLTLRNVTLAMNCSTENGTFTIDVWGSLDISDLDGDPATTSDYSNITDSPFDVDDRSSLDFRTAIKVYSGASLSIENSIIREMGYKGGGNNLGLFIDTNSVNIQNCTIENCLYGFYSTHDDFHTIGYNEFRYCDQYGINYAYGDYVKVYNNVVHHNDYGMHAWGQYNTIFNNYIHNNSNVFTNPPTSDKHGLYLRVDYSEIYNNTIEYNAGTGWCENVEMIDCHYIQFHHNRITNVKSGSFSSLYIYGSSNMDFHNNTISDNDDSGLRFSMSGTSNNNKFANNNISNNDGYGIFLQYGDEDDTYIFKDNVLINNSVGLELRQLRYYNFVNNTISLCRYNGVYINDVDGGDYSNFSNNTINATNYDFYLRDTVGPGDTVLEVLNCTFDPSKVNITYEACELVILNYLHLNVTDINSWVPGAYIVVKNNTDEIVFEGESDEDGQVRFIVVNNQTITKTENISYDPYNITATLDVHTAYGEIEPIMNVSQTVNVNFKVDLPPVPPGGLTAISNKTNVDLNWEPCVSSDADHYLVYRNQTGSGWLLVYDSSTSPGKELWTNWTDFHAASDWATYRYYITCVDQALQESQPSNVAQCGDWVVNDTLEISDLSTQMNGSLIILSTGNLTLKSVEIEFNCTFTDFYGIKVQPNGKFWILDNDDNPLTTGDRSYIFTINESYYFIMNGSEFVMKNSKLEKCGSDEGLAYGTWDFEIHAPQVMTAGEPWFRGLYISDPSADITVKNNDFSNNFVSILVDGTRNCDISGNTFSSNTFGIYLNNSDDNILSDNTFTDHQAFPIYILNSETNSIYENDIINPSSIQAGLVLFEGGCQANKIFKNNFTGGEYGVHIWEAGNNNNISNNYFDDLKRGVSIGFTIWNTILENDFNNTSQYDYYLFWVHSSIISKGTSNWANEGYYLENSNDNTISDIIIENSSSSGIHLENCNNVQITNITIKSCGTGIQVSGGNNLPLTDITIEDCTTGISCTSNPTFIELIKSRIYSGTVTAISINTCENFIVDNCSLNATNYNFNLIDADVTSYNTTFNQLKITLDLSSSISLWWLVNVRVYNWLGNPQQNAEVQIRNIAGTLIFEGFTDVNGYIGWIWMHERIQFATSKELYTPHTFHAYLGNHAGSNGLHLNQSTLVSVWLQNKPPQVSNVIISPSYPTTTDDLNLTYQYSDDEGDPQGSTKIIWYIDGVNITSFNNMLEINSSNTSKGQTWFCEVIPHDGTTYGIPMTSTPVSIQNTPPVVTGVVINETNPTSSDNLHVNYTFYDIDGDNETQSQYKWYVNDGFGYVYSGVDSLELDSSHTKKGDLWKCIVTPHDGDNLGASEESPEVLIDNSAPGVSDVIILPTSPKSNETITANYTYFDLDNDLESGSTIRWYKNGIEQWNLNDSDSVDSSLTLKGETWYYVVTPSDGDDFGDPAVSDPVIIGNTPPSVFNITISPLNPTTEDVLRVDYEFFDNDGDSESLDTIVKWLRWNGFEFFDTGLRGKNLSSEHTFKGENWTCEVIPNDGFSEGLVNRSTMNVTIGNSAPEILSAYITPTNPTSDSNLEVDYEYWDVDFDSESGSTIRWYKNAVEQWNLNDSTSVDSTLTLKGETWYYIYTPSDGEDFGTPFMSVSITIGNTPPYVLNITISPQDPTTEDVLTVSYEFYDNDGDLESLDTVVKWLRYSGSEFFDTGLRGKNLSSEHTNKGEMWTCEVIPHDGISEGLANRSHMNVSINNSAPKVLSASITPSDPTADSDLQVDFQFVDPDKDSDSGSKIRWYKDGMEQWNLNDSDIVDSSLTLKGEIWYYIITPSDGEDFGDPFISVSITIGNTLPYVLNITIAPLNPDTEDILTVSYEFYDNDGDSESLDTVIKWLRWSGSEYFDTGLRGKNLSSDHTSRAENWTCEVIPHDGLDEGAAIRSDMNVTIVNSKPGVSDAYVTPSEPTADSDLLADYQFIDP
ncbi:MAG: right-handed parallel beta-helix repeat-containing protein, partial [Thermoplasmata archaeon]